MRRAIYEDDVIKLLDKGRKSGVYPVASNIHVLPSAQPEPCEDAVSREEAKWVVFCNRDHVEDQANAIDALPSVQPEQRWIPCGKCIHADGKHRMKNLKEGEVDGN